MLAYKYIASHLVSYQDKDRIFCISPHSYYSIRVFESSGPRSFNGRWVSNTYTQLQSCNKLCWTFSGVADVKPRVRWPLCKPFGGKARRVFSNYEEKNKRQEREHVGEILQVDSFAKKWKQQLESLHVTPTPFFFSVFNRLHDEESSKGEASCSYWSQQRSQGPAFCLRTPLDYEECNDLHYMAGYVIKALLKKMKKSAHPLKDTTTICLKEMIENKEGGACKLQLLCTPEINLNLSNNYPLVRRLDECCG